MLCRIMHAGKTTVLRHLLQNKTNLRIGCIVNDVASINVDAKLLRNDRNRGRSQEPKSTADLTDTIELANGCACEQRHMSAVCRWCAYVHRSLAPAMASCTQNNVAVQVVAALNRLQHPG